MSEDLSADLASLRIDRDAQNPDRKSPLRYLVYLAIIAVVGFGLYTLAADKVQTALVKTEVDVVEISLVSPAQASIELTSTGYVVPQVVSLVTAQVGGRVIETKVDQGDTVAAGDVLLALDVANQKAAIAAARSRVATARANAQTARANLAEGVQQAEREKRLAADGVSPKATADDLARRVQSLRAAVRAADAQIRAAQAEVNALEVNLENFTVTSPIKGTVLNKPARPGEFVGPSVGGIASQSGAIEIADLESQMVETDVPEGRLHLVAMGSPTEIVLDAFPERRFRGRVAELVPRIDRAKATVTVKVAFVDDSAGALPDMSARVSFLSGELDADAVTEAPKVVVPEAAVVDRAGATVVFAVEGDRVRMVPVEVGPAFAGGFEMLNGPSAGTRVVARPPDDLVDGQKVKRRGES